MALAVALIYAGSVVEVVVGGPDVWFESVSMFVFFLSVGRYLEMRARHRAGDLSDALAGLSPVFADRIEADGSLVRVGAIELAPGDRVIVADGAGVPADGVLESAQCRVDEALLCGESAPLTRHCGEMLCAGSVVIGNPATMRVTRVGADTVVAGIVALTARAATTKPRLARAGERAAAGFIARVLLLAACTAIGWAIADPERAFSATVAVLVVACPCAFALAAPAAVTRTLAVLAGRGVLVVRPDALEDLAAATHVIFDKTGTLTEPSIARNRTVMLRDTDGDAALAVAAALAQGSSPPTCACVRCRSAGCAALGRRAGKCRGLWNRRRRSTDAAIASVESDYAWPFGGQPSDLDDAVILADDDGAVAAFHIDERLHPSARAAVVALARDGLSVAIASGDSQAKVAAVAGILGIQTWVARQAPAEKLAWLASLHAAWRACRRRR